MKTSIEKNQQGLLEMKSESSGSAIFFVPEKSFLAQNIYPQIENLLSENNFGFPVVVLSEAHQKPDIKTPSGSIIAATEIIPEMIDAAPNCGMRLIKTDLSNENLNEETIEKLFEQLKKDIPTGGLRGKTISLSLVKEIFQNGSEALAKKFPIRTKGEFENTYEKGNFFSRKNHGDEVGSSSVPFLVSWIAKFRLNLLGATKSHFLTLVRADEISDEVVAKKLGITRGQYLFFMHTGSSIVGRYAASLFTKRKIRNLLQKIILFLIKIFWKPEKEKLFSVLSSVSNYGFANRTLLTCSLDEALERFFQRKINLELVYDAPHVHVAKESHGSEEIWIHRNGANRAFGCSKMSSHPVFSSTGEPVLIAPFAGGFGYLAVGTDENELSYFSANHEIGKISDLEIPREKYPEHAEKTISEMERNKMIKLVAKLKPLKTLTYDK